jgi:hypothetical protein
MGIGKHHERFQTNAGPGPLVDFVINSNGGHMLRTLAMPVAAAIALIVGLSAPSAAPLTGSLPGVTAEHGVIELVQDSRYCRRLRRACEFKEERGEVGEGNCRRYRRECRSYRY